MRDFVVRKRIEKGMNKILLHKNKKTRFYVEIIANM